MEVPDVLIGWPAEWGHVCRLAPIVPGDDLDPVGTAFDGRAPLIGHAGEALELEHARVSSEALVVGRHAYHRDLADALELLRDQSNRRRQVFRRIGGAEIEVAVEVGRVAQRLVEYSVRGAVTGANPDQGICVRIVPVWNEHDIDIGDLQTRPHLGRPFRIAAVARDHGFPVQPVVALCLPERLDEIDRLLHAQIVGREHQEKTSAQLIGRGKHALGDLSIVLLLEPASYVEDEAIDLALLCVADLLLELSDRGVVPIPRAAHHVVREHEARNRSRLAGRGISHAAAEQHDHENARAECAREQRRSSHSRPPWMPGGGNNGPPTEMRRTRGADPIRSSVCSKPRASAMPNRQKKKKSRIR